MNVFNRLSIAIGLALLAPVALAQAPIKPKVMLITMFAPEAQTWMTVWRSSRKCACRVCRPNIQ